MCKRHQVDIWTGTSDAEEYDQLSLTIAKGVTNAVESTRPDNHQADSDEKAKGRQDGGVSTAEEAAAAAAAAVAGAQDGRTKGENEGATKPEYAATAADGDKAEAGQTEELSAKGVHAETRYSSHGALVTSTAHRIIPISMSVFTTYILRG